ncbi:Protein of unknown function [Nitrosospira multiformis]|uniref:Uncharacterized protein n=2 Tax=Nitrosospira multiformis TaxID=1231 RepID=A0A1I0D3H2_9PROT|nr:Protein of unknown function [Nitrosospira multiformis]
MHPIAGFVLGGALGVGAEALSGSLADYGINDDFIKSLGETIPVNSSALFILVRQAQPEKVAGLRFVNPQEVAWRALFSVF